MEREPVGLAEREGRTGILGQLMETIKRGLDDDM